MGSESDRFYEYYKSASESQETLKRSQGIHDSIVACMRKDGAGDRRNLQVADIGCGAGTQSALWARSGHRAFGIDINEDLIELAKSRSRDAGLDVTFLVGSAESLPWETAQFDVCIVPELLEHVEKWEQCLDEVCRVVKPGGYLFLTTTNRLCPKQDEFALPGYSWYPAALKRKCLQLARTTKKDWVEYAEYPAVHWFSPFSLARELNRRGFSSLDRFDIITRRSNSGLGLMIARIVVSSMLLRRLAHMATPYTLLIARNDQDARAS